MQTCGRAVLMFMLTACWCACSNGQREMESSALKTSEAASAGRQTVPLKQARAAADALGADLMSRLASEMNRGGPAAAVWVCSEVAQEIAARHSTESLNVRRVSLRVRNPNDRPDSFERAQLERLEALSRQDKLPREVVEIVQEDGREVLRYLRPIVVGELCLKCHGERRNLDPEVKEILAERYPEDEAVGYQAGDLRGVVSVRVALE